MSPLRNLVELACIAALVLFSVLVFPVFIALYGVFWSRDTERPRRGGGYEHA